MPLDIASSYLLKYDKRKTGTAQEFNQVGADVSSAGIDKGHRIETSAASLVYLDTKDGNDSNSGDSAAQAKKTYAAAAAAVTGLKTAVNVVNDYPLVQSNDFDGFISTNIQFDYWQPIITTGTSPTALTGVSLSVAYNQGTFLKLVRNWASYEYYIHKETDSAVADWTDITSSQPVFITTNNPVRIYSDKSDFYLFYSDRTFKAGIDGVFVQISAVNEFAYDVAWTTQNVIKVVDTSPPDPDDVTEWGSGNNWGSTSWANPTGAKRLMIQPLTLSSETPNFIADYLDDDEQVQCIAVNSQDRVYVGTVNPEQSVPDDVAYWDTGEWDINTWWNELLGSNQARIWCSDDLATWTLVHDRDLTDNQGVRDILVTDSGAVYALLKDNNATTWTILESLNGTTFSPTVLSIANTTDFGQGSLYNIKNMPGLVTYYEDSANSGFMSILLSSQGVWTENTRSTSAATMPTDYIESVYGQYEAHCTGTNFHNYPISIYHANCDKIANAVVSGPNASNKTFKGCIIKASDGSSQSGVIIEDSIIYQYTASAFSSPTIENSHLISYATGSSDLLSTFGTLTNSRLVSLEYDQSTTLTGLTIDSLAQSTVRQLNASLCKFLNQDGALSLDGGAALTDCYFSNDWSFSILNDSIYSISINHCTFDGSASFTGASAPSAWSSENCIFLNISFPDIVDSANYVSILYAGIVGSAVGVVLSENVRRDNPQFQPNTDGLLQRELDGFLFDSPYIRQASDVNASTGANRDLGCYNIDDSLIAATYQSSVYLPKPPGASITITETPKASVHTAVSGLPDVYNDPSKRTEQIEITYRNIDNSVYDVYKEIETRLQNMSIYLALDPYYLTELPAVTASAVAPVGQTFIEIQPVNVFAGSRLQINGVEYYIRYKVKDSNNKDVKLVLDRPLETSVSFGDSVDLYHPVGTGEYQYVPQPRTYSRPDSQDIDHKGPFKAVFVRKSE